MDATAHQNTRDENSQINSETGTDSSIEILSDHDSNCD